MPVNPLPGMPETLKGDLTAERYICGIFIMKIIHEPRRPIQDEDSLSLYTAYL